MLMTMQHLGYLGQAPPQQLLPTMLRNRFFATVVARSDCNDAELQTCRHLPKRMEEMPMVAALTEKSILCSTQSRLHSTGKLQLKVGLLPVLVSKPFCAASLCLFSI